MFGCVCYIKITTGQTTKLDDRGKGVLNLGKEPGTKCYRLYEPVSKRIFVSRDVVFAEAQAWKWENCQEQSTGQTGQFIVFGFEAEGTNVNEETNEKSGSSTEGFTESQEEMTTPISVQSSKSDSSNAAGDDSEPRKFR